MDLVSPYWRKALVDETISVFRPDELGVQETLIFKRDICVSSFRISRM